MEILSLGEKIKRRRKELHLTLKDLAGDRITPGQISLVESGKSNPSMDLLEYLAANLNSSIEYLMESEDTQAENICTYYENIAESYILNGDFSLGEQFIEKALYYAEKYNLEYRKANNLYLRGYIYKQKGENSIAQQYFLSANVVFIKNSNYEETINTFINLGEISFELKSYHSACSYFQQAEKAYNDNDMGNDFILGKIYYYIANAYFKLENMDKAINYSYLAKEKFRQLNDIKEYSNSLLLLAQEYSKKGDVLNAIKYSKKTLSVFKKINDSTYISEIENSMGKLFRDFDNIEESFIHFNNAKEIRKTNKDPKIVDTFANICENYIKVKNIDMARDALNSILDNRQANDEESYVKYYLLKYKVELLDSNVTDAENTLLMAFNYVKSIDMEREAAEISIMIGKFYVDYGREKEAAGYLNIGVELLKKQGIIKDI